MEKRRLTNIHHGVYNLCMTRTQIYLPKTQLDVVRRIAVKERSTVSEVIRNILKERFKDGNRLASKGKVESLVEAADRISKMGFRGPKDLASRLDHYLYGRK